MNKTSKNLHHTYGQTRSKLIRSEFDSTLAAIRTASPVQLVMDTLGDIAPIVFFSDTYALKQKNCSLSNCKGVKKWKIVLRNSKIVKNSSQQNCPA